MKIGADLALIKFRYHHNPLEVVWLDATLIISAETGKSGGTEISTRLGLAYSVAETPDEVGVAVNQALGYTTTPPGADGGKPQVGGVGAAVNAALGKGAVSSKEETSPNATKGA